MSRRRGQGSIAANPVLVGAVTVLVAVVAVFLAYNANSGLPFVPTRELQVQIPNGANLVNGNEVRSGGYRVGVVEDMEPVRFPNGKVGARLSLKLDNAIGEIPVDSTVTIRPRSALGLKYVELTTGRSPRTLDDGGTLPASQSTVQVDLDELYDTFDAPTRRASQRNLDEFGDAFVGRGGDIGETLAVAPDLFGHLARVARQAGAPDAHLADFFKELDDTVRIIAPVSDTNTRLISDMATTFDAISRDPEALQSTITKSPGTLDVGTRSLRVQRPFLAHSAALSGDLAQATGQLRAALPSLNRAISTGTPVTRDSAGLYDDLDGAMGALRRLAVAPTTLGALRGLTATVTTLQPQLRYLGPYITVCNSWNFLWTFAAEHFTSPNPTGGEQRALLNSAGVAIPELENNDGIDSDNANEFAHGVKTAIPGDANQLHGNFYGQAVTDEGLANCEAGQQGYMQSANPFRDRTIKGDPYRDVSVDHPANPGNLRVGPSYKKVDRQGRGIGLNPDRVPPGQTFTPRPGGRGADVPALSSYPPEGK